MFKINFRIVDDVEKLKVMNTSFFDCEWQQITGFFQLYIGNHQEGSYFHEKQLGDDEVGPELLDSWFNCLLKVVKLLETETNYVAVKELETVKTWLEFRRVDNDIIINVAMDTELNNNQILFTEVYHNFLYMEPLNFTLPLVEFKNHIVDASILFIDALKNLNVKLLDTQMVLSLLKKISEVTGLYN